ncbi:MAG: hypothetical protein ACFFG0_06075 [Candidatus Thorarchaeota archaeon]
MCLKKKFVVSIFLTLLLSFNTVNAWCFFYIFGSTCGKNSANPGNIIFSGFNLDNPEKISTDAEKSPNKVDDITLEGQSVIFEDDLGNTDDLSINNIVSPSVALDEMLWYNVDLVDVQIKCPSCPFIDGKKRFIPGHEYEIAFKLVNQGNALAEGVRLFIETETPSQDIEYSYNNKPISLLPGSYTLKKIHPKIPLDENTIYKGQGEAEFDFKVKAYITNDKGVVQPARQILEKKIRSGCKEYKEDDFGNKVCIRGKYKTKLIEMQCCGDYCTEGTLNVRHSECLNSIPDNYQDNRVSKTFYLQKLTPILASKVGLKIR